MQAEKEARAVKAAVFTQFGEPDEVLTIREVELPTPAAGEVRVRMLASPVNPSDLLMVRGRYGVRPTLPATPGFEGCGMIDAVGPGWVRWLRGLRPGMPVATLNPRGGNWQEYVILSAQHVVPTGDLPTAQAATFFVNPATAYVMSRQVLRVQRGEWLLQTAAGSALGRMVQRLGQQHGFRVLNVVRRPEQAEQMRQAGLTATAVPLAELPAEVRRLTGSNGVRHAIDAVGGSTAEAVVRCLAPGGRLLVYGALADEPMTIHPRELMLGNIRLEGFWLSEWIKRQSIPTLLRLFARLRRLMKAGVVTTDVEEYPLEQIQQAVRQAEAVGKPKKVLLRIAADGAAVGG